MPEKETHRGGLRLMHPAALVTYTTRSFWLLLIPLARRLAAMKFDLAGWIETAGWDVLFVSLMLIWVFTRYFSMRYEIGDTHLHIRKGIIWRQDLSIAYENISAVTSLENPFDIMLSTARIKVDTDAADPWGSKADAVLVMPRREKARLINRLTAAFVGERGDNVRSYKVETLPMMAFSFFFSSAVSGVILMITFFSGATKIIGNRLQADAMGIVNGLSDALATLIGNIINGISPAGIAVSIVIGAGFVLSFSVNFIKNIGFRVYRRGDFIMISSGLVERRQSCINVKKINMADMRQSLVMKAIGLASVHISVTGYGKGSNEFPVIFPICATRRRKLRLLNEENAMATILPEYIKDCDYIRCRNLYCWRTVSWAAFWVWSVPLAAMAVLLRFPEWYSLVLFISVLVEIPAVWMLFCKAANHFTNGFDITEGSVCARYGKFYEFHSVCVPIERLAEVRISQTIFQRMNGSCDVYVYPAAERAGLHIVRGMPMNEVMDRIEKELV